MVLRVCDKHEEEREGVVDEVEEGGGLLRAEVIQFEILYKEWIPYQSVGRNISNHATPMANHGPWTFMRRDLLHYECDRDVSNSRTPT